MFNSMNRECIICKEKFEGNGRNKYCPACKKKKKKEWTQTTADNRKVKPPNFIEKMWR